MQEVFRSVAFRSTGITCRVMSSGSFSTCHGESPCMETALRYKADSGC